MPFDSASPRGPSPGPEPAPTWGERIAALGVAFATPPFGTDRCAMALLAALATLHAMALALIALWGLGGVALGIAGDAKGAVDCAGGALLTALVTHPFHMSWVGMRALAAGRWP